METRCLGIDRDKRITAKGRDYLAKGLRAPDVTIHNDFGAVWKASQLATLCRDSSTDDGSFFLTQLLKTRGYFFQSFRQCAIELGVGRVRRPAERIAGTLPRGSGRVVDVVGGNPHDSSYVKGMA